MLRTDGWMLPELIDMAEANMKARPYQQQVEESLSAIRDARSLAEAETLSLKDLEKRRLTIAEAARTILLARIAELEADVALLEALKVRWKAIVAERLSALQTARENARTAVAGLGLAKPDETFTIENAEPVRTARVAWENARATISQLHGVGNTQDPVNIEKQIKALRSDLDSYLLTLLGPLPATLTESERKTVESAPSKPKTIVRTSDGRVLNAHTGELVTVFDKPSAE